MSTFVCEHCGAICHDTPKGYNTGCVHYPHDAHPPYMVGGVGVFHVRASELMSTKLFWRQLEAGADIKTDKQ